jgi:hypothetical protein
VPRLSQEASREAALFPRYSHVFVPIPHFTRVPGSRGKLAGIGQCASMGIPKGEPKAIFTPLILRLPLA